MAILPSIKTNGEGDYFHKAKLKITSLSIKL